MKHFQKLFGALAVFLVIWSLLVAGFDMGHHDYQNMVPNLVLGFFWALVLGMVVFEQIHDARFKAEMRWLDRTGKMLEALAEAEMARNAEADIKDIMAKSTKNGDIKVKDLLKNAREAGYEVQIGFENGDKAAAGKTEAEAPKKAVQRTNPNGAMDVVKRGK